MIADLFVGDIVNGIMDTGVKAGIIKCATDHFGVTPLNRKLLQVAS